jgi:hypothetical protein
MSAKAPLQTPKRKKSNPASPPSCATATVSVAVRNLINMVAVSTVSGTVLLGLLAAKHF